MKKAVFKTNINCGGCIGTVTPFLDQVPSIEKWSVDTSVKQKWLTVEGNSIQKDEVMNAVKEAGFEIVEKRSFLGF